MKKIGLFLLAAVMVAGLAGCVSGYQNYYRTLPDVPPIKLLDNGETPSIYYSDDINRDARSLMSKRFVAIGWASFNGTLESTEGALEQARRVGASLVLVRSNHTGTATSTVPLFLPTSTTTTHSGTVWGYGKPMIYSGNSRTTGTMVVPITTVQHRYDQEAVFFAKVDMPRLLGVLIADIPPDLRVILERNAGVVVDIVVEDTPAFAANILPGDILIEVDGTPVRNKNHFVNEIKNQIQSNNNINSVFKIIRNGIEKEIILHLEQN